MILLLAIVINSPGNPITSGDLFEVEISQIHVSLRQYVYGENIFSFDQTDFEKLRSQIAVMPLAPGNGSAGSYVEAICSGPVASFPIHID
jgi:hypothetical protein